ncbi:hypothetical protein [Devosia sp.]|uniref:hypothetical protein n=1 Tax=Devosia sp. TaxID=1871048 RepID=UPI003A946FD7
MTAVFNPVAAGCLVLAAFAALMTGTAMAQETVPMGNGTTVTINEYLIETPNDGGPKTLIVKGVPNFDPEPYGQVPADNYARYARQLCQNLVNNSWAQLQEEGVATVRVRYDFTPTKPANEPPEGVTVTRFHEMRYALADDRTCDPMPYGVREVAPAIPSDVGAVLKYVEYGPDPRELKLTYRLGDSSQPADKLERAAIELCIVHADPILADRAKYYTQLEPDYVTIAFVSGTVQNEREDRIRFPIQGDRCVSGLSDMLVEGIRGEAEGTSSE